MPVFENLGFNNHPFSKTNADEEPNLEEYFVPPPFFDAIVGDSSNPSASIVFAPRGGGKTAQRRMVEKSSAALQFLVNGRRDGSPIDGRVVWNRRDFRQHSR